MAENKSEFKYKLSEAVEKMSYDILPEAKPEDFEITTVAAVSEPFADARVRNKAAREKFKKMIDARTRQAKETLGLDKNLPERQANGNGKLVESASSDADNIMEAFRATKWVAQDKTNDVLSNELQSLNVYNESCYINATNLIYLRLNEAFKEAATAYKKEYASVVDKGIEESKQPSLKISLDENLFESIEDKKSINESKELNEAKIISDAREYKPWIGAIPVYEKIQEAGKLEDFYSLLDSAYPSGIDEQALNDLLWFDSDWIYEMLGMEVEE